MLYGYRYNTLCQPCSSLTYCRFTFQVWLIKSPARSNVQSSRIFVHGFAVYHTQVFYLELSTFNRYRVMFRLKLCSPQLFCFFFKYVHLNSEWDLKCTNSQILSIVYIFASNWKDSNGKETPSERIGTHLWVNRFFWINTENVLKRG